MRSSIRNNSAALAVAAGLMLRLLPDIPRPRTTRSWSIVPAFRADLLRIDFYVFLLHAIMTATFVALPFLLTDSLDLALTDHWKMYVGALLLSLGGTVPLIMRDERRGKDSTMGIAVSLMIAGLLVLTFAGFAVAPVFGGLVLFFAGFNFLEAGLPALGQVECSVELRHAGTDAFVLFGERYFVMPNPMYGSWSRNPED